MAHIKELGGVLHPNKNKRSSKSPDVVGQLMVNGLKYEVAGWHSKAQNIEGEQFLNLKLTFIMSTNPGYDPRQDSNNRLSESTPKQ